MRLLDLFCGAGGAAMGYHRAGFDEIVGVDIKPQPRYPFQFVQADAMDFLAQLIADRLDDILNPTNPAPRFDAIHASPPCQAYSAMSNCRPDNEYPDMVGEVRRCLRYLSWPFVIENVRGAPWESPMILCGKQFGLRVYRHRYFETEPFILAPAHEPHRDSTPKAGRGRSPKGFVSVTGKGGYGGNSSFEDWSAAMGIDWMHLEELAEAIPPAYTEYIGKALLAHIASTDGVLTVPIGGEA